MTTGGRAKTAIAAAAVALALGLLQATPAAADGAEVLLELSHDGVHYSPGTVTGIFQNSGGYVPGESRPGTVWVRNASPDAAQFSLGVVNTDDIDGSVLPAYLNLHVASGNRSATAESLPAATDCYLVIESWMMPGGESLRLDLDLGLAVQAPNATRSQQSTFDLVFVLQGIGGGQPVSPCVDSPAGVPTTDLPSVVPDNVSVGTARVSGGTTAQASEANSGLRAADAGVGVGSVLFPAATPDFEVVPETGTDESMPWYGIPSPQSNVVANIRSLWPWLVPLAGAFMVFSLRRRRRTQ